MNNLLPIPQLLVRELRTDEIYIWHACLEQPASQFQSLLSVDERNRAERFHFEADRKRFIVRRGILRTLLSYYLGVEPGQIQFCYGKNGKPDLADTLGKGTIHFNLSLSEGVALYAFTRDREIGVDIELIRNIPEMEPIVAQYFSAGENDVFSALPKSKRKEAFYDCWTRKEAFVKATGDGLSLPLNGFDVSLAPGEPTRLLRIEGDSGPASGWSIQDLKLVFGFAAAFAVKGRIGSVHCWQWCD